MPWGDILTYNTLFNFNLYVLVRVCGILRVAVNMT